MLIFINIFLHFNTIFENSDSFLSKIHILLFLDYFSLELIIFELLGGYA